MNNPTIADAMWVIRARARIDRGEPVAPEDIERLYEFVNRCYTGEELAAARAGLDELMKAHRAHMMIQSIKRRVASQMILLPSERSKSAVAQIIFDLQQIMLLQPGVATESLNTLIAKLQADKAEMP